MISRILVPTDGSETATKAVKYAADLALKVGAEVTLLAVIEKNFYAAQSLPAAVAPNHLTEEGPGTDCEKVKMIIYPRYSSF